LCTRDSGAAPEPGDRAGLDPLAADGLTLGSQFGVDARRSVSFLVLCMNPPDIGQQIAIGDLARAVRP